MLMVCLLSVRTAKNPCWRAMPSGVAGKWHDDPMFVGANVEHEGQGLFSCAVRYIRQISLGLIKFKQTDGPCAS